MVQLKSFKVIEEPEAPIEERRKEEVDEDACLSANSNSGRSSVSGGNLTSESSQQVAVTSSHDSSSSSIEEDEVTTLSSGQEYQLAKHEIIEEESEDSNGAIQQQAATSQSSSVSNILQKSNEKPLVSRRQQVANQSPRIVNSPSLILTRQPLALRNSMATGGGDNTSLHSLGHRQGATLNHFEVRWHNINLYAGKSKLPKFITENPLYKLLKRDNEQTSDQVCYSPPISYKFPKSSKLTMSESAFISAGTTPTNTRKDPYHVEVGSVTSNGSATLRPILSNVSGSVFSGQMTAILGPSGVGKTSLLNSLTGRNTLEGTGRVSLIGGASKRMSVVTVPQQDILPGKLTTLEDLRFTSRLKNPESGFNHPRNIDRIVKHLQMEKFLNTRIDKLSGGEARRLSIGRELLSSPDIMILDEPTSGLDANTCKKIIMALRDIVEHSDNILDRPMSVLVTIHQPQREVLNLFHRVYVMARGGRVIYEGPPCNLLPTLLDQSSLSQVCQVEQLNENPAIVALEVASTEYGTTIIDELAVHHERQTFEENLFSDETSGNSPYMTPRLIGSPRIRSPPMSVSPQIDFLRRKRGNLSIGRQTPVMNKRNLGNIDYISAVTSVSYASTYDADLPEQISKLKVDKRLRRSVVMKGDFLSHTLILMQRCWLLTTRDMFLMGIRILGFLLVAGGMVQIFGGALNAEEHQCPNYETEVDDIISFMQITRERLFALGSRLQQSNSTHLFFFHLILCIVMVTSALTGLVFPLQMRMFIREYKNGWYSPASFVTSLTLAELPVDIIGPLISLLITYPLCNQPVSDYYWREIGYVVILILAAIICKSQAQIAGALLMDSIENSVFVSCVLVTPPALLSGIPLRVSQMSGLLQFISYGNFLRYVFESLLVLRYGYGICPCDPELVNGYPIRTSADAIPPQLDNLARGFLELNQNSSTTPVSTDMNSVNDLTTISPSLSDNPNFFVQILRLVIDSNNLFVPNIKDLGDCTKYRSLFLMDMAIEDKIIPKWLSILLFMFILSRFITYFVIKTVIKMRKQ